MKKRRVINIILFLSFFKSMLFAQSTGMVIYENVLSTGKVTNESHLYFSNEKSIYFSNRGKKQVALSDMDGKPLDSKKLLVDIENKKPGVGIYMRYIDQEGNLVYMDWRKDSLIFREILYHNPLIVVEPHLPKLNWNITNVSKKIGKFDCTKAMVTFRGRKYEAWFTAEIPVPSGPWKLHGLPGLILEANDSSMTFIYKFHSIEIPAQHSEEIIVSPKIGTVVSLSEYDKTRNEILENYVRKVNSTVTPRGGSRYMKLPKNEDQQELNFDD